MTLPEKEVKQIPLHTFPSPIPISPVPLHFSKSLLVALPCSNMEPSPKKAKQDPRNSTKEDADAIRKLMAAFEKHIKLKKHSQTQVEQELKMAKEVVKRDPTLLREENCHIRPARSDQSYFTFI